MKPDKKRILDGVGLRRQLPTGLHPVTKGILRAVPVPREWLFGGITMVTLLVVCKLPGTIFRVLAMDH